ncbi:hypothetical protein RDI58_014968 [Solanum bulbocastanum]|uniref:MADS-box domain-containing protein n=1 Tax=Solanum bulbocastanum TaxID=147425 RepID=A0AAN8TKN9_SOLBU
MNKNQNKAILEQTYTSSYSSSLAMPRNKVIIALIENKTDRKVSYKKKHKGFLKKAHELVTLCEVDMVVIIYSPYSDEPKVLPNHSATINTFRKFKELVTSEI